MKKKTNPHIQKTLGSNLLSIQHTSPEKCSKDIELRIFIQIGHLLACITKHNLIIVSATVLFSTFEQRYHILAVKMR